MSVCGAINSGGDAPSFRVERDCLVDGGIGARRQMCRGTRDRFLDDFGDFKEADPSGKEGLDRYLVGSAQDIGGPAAGASAGGRS